MSIVRLSNSQKLNEGKRFLMFGIHQGKLKKEKREKFRKKERESERD